ncbi:hypothetical protein B0H14DRAFT_2808287 [Mycena olivaceomarginata]|nr:hypothetical protein B0H14DRAFT_2808287 [Mycena olivaceomarginata]
MDNEQTNKPQRVQDLWFEDGNLVIQTGNSQYRVYRGLLATCSGVFTDMLSFPQPADAELVEGCPLVRLLDPDVEVTPFLKAIFQPDFFMPFPAPTALDAIVGCLRLSHKYGVDYLRRRALIHLSSRYPTKLRRGKSLPTRLSESVSSSSRARVEATCILPWAFYGLSANFDKIGADIFTGNVGNPLCLPVDDQASFLNGHNWQTTSTAADAPRFLWHPLNIPGCEDPSGCHTQRLNAMEAAREGLDYGSSIFFDIWREEEWDYLHGVCPTCLRALRNTHTATRRAFFDKLPEMYNLPSWAQLEQLRTDAIGDSPFD